MNERLISNIHRYIFACIVLLFVFSLFLLTSCSSQNYKLVFHTNSEDSIANISKTKKELETYTLAEPKKEGYTFVGWYFDDSYEHPYNFESLSKDKNLIDLYAKYTVNQYTITVHSTENIEYKFKYGEDIEVAPLEKGEHNFVAYYTDEALTKEFDLTVMPANDIDLYPKFDEVYYTLVFHTNSENSIANISKTKVELESYTLAEPQKEGYTFDGWYFDNAYEHPYNFESLSKDNTLVELYAKYKINEYNITVHSTDNIEYKFKYGETIEVAPLEKAEHNFVGYFTDEGLTKEFNLTTMSANNIDLYPKFDDIYYTLIFHTNSEDNISNISKTKEELESYTLAIPEKEGYTFEGWYFDNAYEHPYSYESLSKDKTLIEIYAKYKINEYTITIHSPETIEYKFKYGETIEIEPVEKTEHNFVGYYTDEGLTKEFNLTTMSANNIDLYPKFDEVYYTLVFHTNSEDNISNISKTKEELETYTLVEPKKEGYTFEGWYFDDSYEHPYSFESLSKDKTLIELYAKYRINEYTITVHLDENIGYKFNYGETIEVVPLDKPEYNFVGYYLDEAFTKEFNLTSMPANNIDLYPKFDEVYYALVFHTNSEDSIANISKTKAELESYTLAEPQKEGYTFDGWYFDNVFAHPYSFESLSKENTLIELYAKYHETPYSYEVDVHLNISNSATLSGGDIKQIITNDDNQFDCIEIEPNYGYKYLYYEIDGIKYSNSNIHIENVNKDIIVDVICDYETYELPIINIDTNNNPILNKIDYVPMNFSIENCNDVLSNVSGGIRLRGNSTMGYLKKPYRLKFDKKQSLFGLEKSKSWVLLADFLDPSCLHNYAALTLGNDLDGLAFTPTPNKVNVYMNGEYIGLYTLAEQVQEGKGRIDIEKTITEDMVNLKDYNFFIALDASVTGDADAVLDETYFILNKPGQDMVFELKYPEKADFVSEEQFNNFFAELKNYISSLVDSFIDNDYSAINNEVNLNSLVDYLIIDEILMEHDHYYKSFNMYFTSTSSDSNENNKLNFGPIWDYDWSLDTPWTGKPNDYYLISNDIFYSNVFFGACNNVSEIKQLLKDRYTQNMSSKLGLFIDELMIYEDSIKASLELNANKWYTEGYKLTLDNIIFLNKHLLNRKRVLDNEWVV